MIIQSILKYFPIKQPSMLPRIDTMLHTVLIITLSYLFFIIIKEKIKKYKKDKTLPISKYITNDNIDTCSICLEELKQNEIIRTTQCKHIYHKECLDKWTLYKKDTKCPNCNQELHV